MRSELLAHPGLLLLGGWTIVVRPQPVRQVRHCAVAAALDHRRAPAGIGEHTVETAERLAGRPAHAAPAVVGVDRRVAPLGDRDLPAQVAVDACRIPDQEQHPRLALPAIEPERLAEAAAPVVATFGDTHRDVIPRPPDGWHRAADLYQVEIEPTRCQ